MAARNDTHATVLRPVRIDRDSGLHVGGGEGAESRSWSTEADVLVVAEFPGGSRWLPMELIDDLLEIGTDKRSDDFHQPPIKPKAVERRIEIGWPLHEANGAADPRVFRNAEEDILVPITGAVAQALGVNTVECGSELGDLPGAEDV